MSVAGRLVRSVAKKVWTRFMDRVGSRFVSGLADTSSDAPSAGFQPKRNLYAEMRQGNHPRSAPAAAPAPAPGPVAAPARTHEHDHGHSHDHGHDHKHG
jgi:hypothetical protein